jgi:hypothetical protein
VGYWECGLIVDDCEGHSTHGCEQARRLCTLMKLSMTTLLLAGSRSIVIIPSGSLTSWVVDFPQVSCSQMMQADTRASELCIPYSGLLAGFIAFLLGVFKPNARLGSQGSLAFQQRPACSLNFHT